MMRKEVGQCQAQRVIPCKQARQVSWTCLRSVLRKHQQKERSSSKAIAAASLAESHGERTRFESDRHGVYNSADRRPDFLRQLDLGLIGVTGDDR